MDIVKNALEAGSGVLRLRPTWVPRIFTTPGGRLRLRRQDLYAFGAHRGGICERWIASTTTAQSGPTTSMNEGLSAIEHEGSSVLLSDALQDRGADLIGTEDYAAQGGWNVLCKLFDNVGSIPHHVHHNAEKAARVGQQPKPESYFFPTQFNAIENSFPFTWFGLEPGTTKAQIKDCLARWNEGDNGILRFTKAYRIEADTGWQVDPGILHGPGSLVTYEPQRNSDVLSMFQSLVGERLIPWDLVIKDVPPELRQDLDYIVDLLDWDANVDPDFARRNRRNPIPAGDPATAAELGFSERWISHGSSHFSAKELTVLPGRNALVKDAAAYGALVVQGYGVLGSLPVEAASSIQFGAMTADEVFVSHAAATQGLKITNNSLIEPLVLLKHFGPGHSEAALLVRSRAGRP